MNGGWGPPTWPQSGHNSLITRANDPLYLTFCPGKSTTLSFIVSKSGCSKNGTGMTNTYHMAPWQQCPHTCSLVAALEVYLGCPVTVLGLHAESWAPMFVLTAPSKDARRSLRSPSCSDGPQVAYWGSWPTVEGRRVRAYRLLLKGELIPGPRTRPISSRLADGSPNA